VGRPDTLETMERIVSNSNLSAPVNGGIASEWGSTVQARWLDTGHRRSRADKIWRAFCSRLTSELHTYPTSPSL